MPNERVLEEKKQAVAALAEKIKTAKSVVFADYRGITVDQDTSLRTELRKAGVEYKVIKNSIIKFAVKEVDIDGLDEHLHSPTAVAFGSEDPVTPAKLLSEFAKKNKKFSLKAGIMDGKVIDSEGLKVLAALPSREILIATVLGGLKAPISGFANVLNANLRGLAIAINAIAEKKAQAEA